MHRKNRKVMKIQQKTYVEHQKACMAYLKESLILEQIKLSNKPRYAYCHRFPLPIKCCMYFDLYNKVGALVGKEIYRIRSFVQTCSKALRNSLVRGSPISLKISMGLCSVGCRQW